MFFILELQVNGGVGTSIMKTADTKNEAMSEYHNILKFAAVSSVEQHSCVVMDEQGRYLARECYEHFVEEQEDA